MGGHGALTLYLSSLSPSSPSSSHKYRSASAFAPISNPVNAPWGKKAFGGYLQGGTEEARVGYDATEVVGALKGKVEGVRVFVDYVRAPFYLLYVFLGKVGMVG